MILRSRGAWRALVVSSAVALTLAGCGSSGTPKATSGSPSTTPSPSAPSSSASSSTSPTGTSTTAPAGDVEVIQVKKFGVSFELPKGWISLDAKQALKGKGKNPFLDDLAERLGMTGEQLTRLFATSVQTMSVSDSGANHGFLTNVNTIGQEGDLNDDQLKLQMATVGAKIGALAHASADAGDLTRMSYDLTAKGVTIRGVAIAVHTEVATVLISVSSLSEAESGRIADQIQASLKPIPGTGPNA